jgi:hypothetical protein
MLAATHFLFDRSPNMKYTSRWFRGQLYTHSFEGSVHTFSLQCGFMISAADRETKKKNKQLKRRRMRRVGWLWRVIFLERRDAFIFGYGVEEGSSSSVAEFGVDDSMGMRMDRARLPRGSLMTPRRSSPYPTTKDILFNTGNHDP